jgi:hypothetical protein
MGVYKYTVLLAGLGWGGEFDDVWKCMVWEKDTKETTTN